MSTRSAQADFCTTMNYTDVPQFAARARLTPRPPTGKLSDALAIVGRVLRLAWREDALLLASSWGRIHPDVLACAVIGFYPRRRRPVIVLSGCMWEPNQGLRGRLEKILIKLANRAIHRYAVQSTEELTVFPQVWGVNPAKLRLCPFCVSLSHQELAAADAPLPDSVQAHGNYIFAGGNSHRDYEPLLAAARQLPQQKFILATRLLNDRTDLPPNVSAGPVSHPEFIALLRGARANVIPIRQGLRRAVGQQTYLTSMFFGRPTVVTNTPGVRDHIRHGETGWVVNGSAESYVAALAWALDPANAAQVTQMGTAAKNEVQASFTRQNHVTCLLNVMDEAVQAAQSPAADRQKLAAVEG